MSKKTRPQSHRKVTIGKLRPANTVEFAEHEGTITTLDIHVRIALFSNAKQTPPAPDYQVKAQAADGDYYTIGSAWKKKGNTITGDYFSLSVDEPSFPYPLNVVAFPECDDVYAIKWERHV